MKDNKVYIFIIVLNLFLSLLTVHISPRADIITLVFFVIANAIIFALLLLNERHRRNRIKFRIDKIFNLLHSLDSDSNNYEVLDDEFGKLGDEIAKIIVENKITADRSTNNEQILREYTEDIAHQLKTPLTGILLMLDLMEEDNENKKDYIGRIRNSTDRLLQLVGILLKLASIDSGTIKMKKENLSAKSLIDEVISEMEILFESDSFAVPVSGKDFKLSCDKEWTYEAIFNVMKNGLEASKEKGIKVHLKETNIYSSIIIEDFGDGISDDMLKKVYKRFYKGNKNSKGYGIGLPMAKTIIEKQNGELIYTKGKGSNCFEFRFYR